MYSTIIRAFALIASFSNIVNGQAEGLAALNRFATLTSADPAQVQLPPAKSLECQLTVPTRPA